MNQFDGFDLPEQNYSKLPHAFIDLLPVIDSMAEMKIVIYTLRHTWGFSEYGKPKKITVDEYMYGRKKRDPNTGEIVRMDNGTGLSENSVRNGLEKAIEHKILEVTIDDRDKARIEKFYSLVMRGANFAPLDSDFAPLDSILAPRTEKETKGKIKNNIPTQKKPTTTDPRPPSKSQLFMEALEKYFDISLNVTFRAHKDFLVWAIDTKKITPEQVKYASETWAEDENINWKGKRNPDIKTITELWNVLIKGFNKLPTKQEEGRDAYIE